MLKNLTFWAEIDEIDGFLVIFYSSKILVQGLTTNGHHKSFFCYLFYVAIYMRYLKSVVRPLVLFFWEVCVSGLQWDRVSKIRFRSDWYQQNNGFFKASSMSSTRHFFKSIFAKFSNMLKIDKETKKSPFQLVLHTIPKLKTVFQVSDP